MNKKFIFPTFYFQPVQLISTVEKLEKKYKHGMYLPERLVTKRLPDLLAKIRALPNDEAAIIQFANNLKTFEINVLVFNYPYETENLETSNKIITILIHRYTHLIGRRFWNYFQNQFKDENINKVLVHAFHQKDENFLGLSNRIRENYSYAFNSTVPEYILKYLASFIGKENKAIYDSFEDYKINVDSLLAKELWLRILEQHLWTPNYISLQGEELVVRTLENVPLSRYMTIIIKYLDAVNYREYNEALLTQVVDRLRDPRHSNHYWKDVPESVVQKVRAYLIENDLRSFFMEHSDNERFQYWQKFSRNIDNTKKVNDPPIIAMFFNDFVAVEFGYVGNAAYFYEKESFNKYLLHEMREGMRESYLKDKHAHYYINSLSHSGYWQSRFDQYMVNYLNGNFYYSHRW